MNRNCDLVLNQCFPCADGNPFANLSAEDPDLNIFLSVQFRETKNPPPNIWTSPYCVTFCESQFSQNDADDCARRLAYQCSPENNNCLTPPCSTSPPIPNNRITCTNGDTECEIEAGTVLAVSQVEADAIAQSLCTRRCTEPTDNGGTNGGGDDQGLNCPTTESGVAAPTTFEIEDPVTWIETQTINAPDPWVVDGSFLRFDTYDIPPGGYKIYNLDGYNVNSGAPCPGANTLIIYPGIHDDEGAVVSCCNVCSFGTCLGLSEDFTRTNCNFGVDSGSPGQRLNGTGACFLLISDHMVLGGSDHTPIEPHVFSLIQTEGLVPQPRKVDIANYAAAKPHFADQSAANAWQGTINERIEYEAMSAQWAEPIAGSFGGAVLAYTQSHPTSANGRGWVLSIYSVGAVLMWRGYKGVGATPLGFYFQDSTTTPVGPACLECIDFSDDVWYPGETQPT